MAVRGRTHFDHCANLDELEATYKKLALEHHPDMGGDVRTMQKINAEYDKVFAVLKELQNLKAASCLWNCTKKRWYRRHTEGTGVDGLAADHLPAGRRKAAKVNTWPMLEPPAARNRSAAKLFSRPFGQP